MEPDVPRRTAPLIRLVGFERRPQADVAATRTQWSCSPTLATAVAAIASAGASLEEAWSAPGDLDPTFGDVGRIANFGQPTVWSLDVLDDGELVFGAGDEYCSYWYSGCFQYSGFGRLLASGAPDAAFNAAALEDTAIYDTALQDDGSLVAVGIRIVENQRRLIVVRLLPDGSLDPGFGTDGAVLLPDATMGTETGRAIHLEDDGRIVVAGTRGEQVLVARLSADGNLDSTFGNGGVALHGEAVGSVVALARVATGYRVVGNAFVDRPTSGRLTCQVFGILPDGVPDPAFGDDGSGKTTLYVDDSGGQACESAAVQPDGRLVLSGGPGPSSADDAFLARMLADGTTDGSFKSSALAGVLRSATAVAFGSGGRIYVAGTRDNGLGGATIVRLLADGTLDMLYGKDGASDFTLPTTQHTWSTVRDLALSPAGTLVVAGRTSAAPQGFVARLLGDGPGGGPGVLSVVTAGTFVTEQEGSATVSVRRLAGSTGAISVSYSTFSLEDSVPAQEGQDYTPVTGTLTWANGETGDREIVVPIMADALQEPAEFIGVQLHSTAGGAGLGATVSQVEIAAASYPAGQIRFGNTTVSIREGSSNDIQVVRDDYAVGQVSVTVRIAGGTAQRDQDFQGADTTLTWADGESGVKNFRLSALRDGEEEQFETVMLELVSPTGGAILGIEGEEARVSIIDATPPSNDGGGGHAGAVGTTLLGLLAWWRRRRGGVAAAH